jgi:lysophospholipase L1-like esterase
MWVPISDYLIGELCRTIEGLAQNIQNFHVARTQGALKRADLGSRLISHDWADEIHPTMGGYMKLAKRAAAFLPTS